MQNRKYLVILFVSTLFFGITSCDSTGMSFEEKTTFKNEDILSLRASKDYTTTVYLIDTNNDYISGQELVSMFLSGWKFQNLVTISGYTATDDIWTIISNKSETSNMLFDKVKIELTRLEKGSKEWETCMKDITSIVAKVTHIKIVN